MHKVRSLKSTPIVASQVLGKADEQNRYVIEVFPTPESPITIILNTFGLTWLVSTPSIVAIKLTVQLLTAVSLNVLNKKTKQVFSTESKEQHQNLKQTEIIPHMKGTVPPKRPALYAKVFYCFKK